MVNFKKLSDQAKNLVEKRGGTEGLKQDAAQLSEIAKGKGTLSEKAKAAAAALKETGTGDPPQPAADADPAAETAPKPDPAAPAAGQEASFEEVERKAERRKEGAERQAGRADPAP